MLFKTTYFWTCQNSACNKIIYSSLSENEEDYKIDEEDSSIYIFKCPESECEGNVFKMSVRQHMVISLPVNYRERPSRNIVTKFQWEKFGESPEVPEMIQVLLSKICMDEDVYKKKDWSLRIEAKILPRYHKTGMSGSQNNTWQIYYHISSQNYWYQSYLSLHTSMYNKLNEEIPNSSPLELLTALVAQEEGLVGNSISHPRDLVFVLKQDEEVCNSINLEILIPTPEVIEPSLESSSELDEKIIEGDYEDSQDEEEIETNINKMFG